MFKNHSVLNLSRGQPHPEPERRWLAWASTVSPWLWNPENSFSSQSLQLPRSRSWSVSVFLLSLLPFDLLRVYWHWDRSSLWLLREKSTFLRHLARASWTSEVQATRVSPSFCESGNTSFKHSANQSCLSLSGNLSTRTFHRCLSPFSWVGPGSDALQLLTLSHREGRKRTGPFAEAACPPTVATGGTPRDPMHLQQVSYCCRSLCCRQPWDTAFYQHST